jgi:hypothetical protein
LDSALTYRRDRESVERRLNFFRAGLLVAYLPERFQICWNSFEF